MRLWEDNAPHMEAALARHDTLLRAAFADHGGRVFASDGDGFGAMFDDSPGRVTSRALAL